MKTIPALSIVLCIGILTGCSQQLDASVSAEPAKVAPDAPESWPGESVSASALLSSFEFLGCSGMWPSDDATSDVWRFRGEPRVRFLVRHVNTCGYTIGSKPSVRIDGNALELSYEMSNTSGELAACECEYWATFELARAPDMIDKITFNGADARLNGNLAGR